MSLLCLITCGDLGAGQSTLNERLHRAAAPDEIPAYAEEAIPDRGSFARRVAAGTPADVALVVLDVTSGVPQQIRYYTYLASLLGIGRIVFAVNKMDLVDYSHDAYARAERECHEAAARLGATDVFCLPLSALHGDNVQEHGPRMPWYEGPTLAGYLSRVPPRSPVTSSPVAAPPTVADRFEATLIWTDGAPMLPGRSYLMRIGRQTTVATVAPLKYKLNLNTLEHVPARKLERDDVGVCGLEVSEPVVFAPYRESRERGGFTLVDQVTNTTVGAGLLHFALHRSQNIPVQPLDISKQARAGMKNQKPCVIWFTGLSGAGKSTVANLVERRLCELGRHTYLLDGDNVRHGLSKDLGFTDADRVENLRRVAEVARLMADAGLIVLVSFISPFRAERRMARALLEPGEFIEVFVDTPLGVAEARDPKGLYLKARRGELKNFTGIDSAYEVPEHPELRIDTVRLSPVEAADAVLSHLRQAGAI